jgi:hypothetical protein
MKNPKFQNRKPKYLTGEIWWNRRFGVWLRISNFELNQPCLTSKLKIS